MNKKWMIGTLTLSLGLLSAGGGVMAASTPTANHLVKTVGASIPGKEGPATINNLTEKSIIPLLIHAKAIYSYASQGGGDYKREIFQYKGEEYRYLSSDIGTEQKLLNYLKKAFTHNAAVYYSRSQFMDHEGRMAQVNRDLGSSLDFEKASARMVSKNALAAVFELKVPYKNQGTSTDVIVKLKKVEGYWRIDVSPNALF
ncbi:DL-endopeptidase inhibitor IseA family protein [Paenibacillus sp. GCM10012306]|uniref:DL-endopeptidase inhibitor IseA family protein n=1 Tax=Paenibacillus sp. GCM10012306 TaxID=3317342 RepID=UPI0036225CAC